MTNYIHTYMFPKVCRCLPRPSTPDTHVSTAYIDVSSIGGVECGVNFYFGMSFMEPQLGQPNGFWLFLPRLCNRSSTHWRKRNKTMQGLETPTPWGTRRKRSDSNQDRNIVQREEGQLKNWNRVTWVWRGVKTLRVLPTSHHCWQAHPTQNSYTEVNCFLDHLMAAFEGK